MNDRQAKGSRRWQVYLLRCKDGTLYSGITVDLTRRLSQHAKGRGARYTRGRAPLRLLASFEVASQGDALRAEAKLKALPRERKLRAARSPAALLSRRPNGASRRGAPP